MSNDKDTWARPDTRIGTFEHTWLMATLDVIAMNQHSRELTLSQSVQRDLLNLDWIVAVGGRWKVTPLGQREREALARSLGGHPEGAEPVTGLILPEEPQAPAQGLRDSPDERP